MTFDISAIVTAHAETVLAGPGMRSAEIAIAQAEAAGLCVERIIGLDNPTPGARAFFEQPTLDGWRRIDMSFRDQGRARNHLSEVSEGDWIAFLDADDLWSENWLVEAARRAEAQGSRKIIVHPELNWFFDRQASILANIPQDSPLMAPEYFYVANYYDALSFAPREAHLEHPFAKRDVPNGFAHEDMQWAIETMAAGYFHAVAQDTIIFKRRQAMSQTIRASQGAASIYAIEPMFIDRIRDLGKSEPHS